MRARTLNHLLAAALLWLGLALPTAAQDPALLVADSVVAERSGRLVATGNVEALFDGQRLSASRIVYDRNTDQLTLDGPIRITDRDGTVLTADSARIDTGFRNGLLRGARVVLDQQLQLAAVEANRVGGRYTQLSRVAVTSCQVCAGGVPLWQIRADRVIHDEQARQLYFDKAQLRFLDVPVFYLPRLRLPDPTLDRAQGFLIPELRSSSLLGFGIKVPYFIPLGDHADLTLTPYVSPVTRTLEARYRQAFVHGDIELNMAASSDTIRRSNLRTYLFADGRFDAGRDFELRFDIEAVSDDAYLNDYDYSGKDRLDSAISISRVRRDERIHAEVIHYQSLRADEDNATQPTIVSDIQLERRIHPPLIGGEIRTAFVAHGHYRYSNDDIVGRDVARAHAEIGWVDRWTLPAGIRLGAEALVAADHYRTSQDTTRDRDVTQITPAARIELRWPLAARGPGGARWLIEPVAQLAWTGGDRPNIAGDESTRVEFDEGNLLALSRFPARDRRERGLAGATGLRLARAMHGGWSAGLTLGQVWRENADADFTRSSGLSGAESDLLVAARFRHASGLSVQARGLLGDGSEVSNAEARAAWSNTRFDLAASYLLLPADASEDRDQTVSEWSLDSAYRFARNWTATSKARYDIADNRLARASAGLEYQNECIEVDFSVSRRFATSSNFEPTTDIGLTVALKGFSTGGSAKEYRRTCN